MERGGSTLPPRHPAFCKVINDAADLLLASHSAILVSSTRSSNGPQTISEKQCATARKIDEPDMNAQDRTFQNDKSSDSDSGQSFCGAHAKLWLTRPALS